jgi:hypothetical protein
MQDKAELIGGPHDGEIVDLGQEPLVNLIVASENIVHQYVLKEKKLEDQTKFFYYYEGHIPFNKI